MFASIIEVIVSMFSYSVNVYQIGVGIILFIVGSFISLKYFQN